MTDASRPKLLGSTLATLASAALVGKQLWLGIHAREAPVSHLLSAPPLAVWVPAAVLVVAALAIAVAGALQRRDPRLARLPYLALAVVLFAMAFLTQPVQPLGGEDDSFALVHACATLVQEHAGELGRLPQTADEVGTAIADLPGPPYLIRGEPVEHWQIEVRRGCSGPALDVTGAPAGTFVYCLAADGAHAWVTGVGRSSSTFGDPELLRHKGAPVSATVELPQKGNSTH